MANSGNVAENTADKPKLFTILHRISQQQGLKPAHNILIADQTCYSTPRLWAMV